MLRVRVGLLAVAVAMVAVACSGADGGGLATVPAPGPTAGPLPTATSVVGSTTSSTVVATTVVVSTTLPAGIGLSADGPWRLVDSAPGVTTPGLVYELMPELWAFIQVEETEQSAYPWVLSEADRPIIEAYLMAQLTYYEAITSNPINLDHPGWTEYYADGGAVYREFLEPIRDEGQVVDMDLGVVFQPQIIGDERTASTATVADCVLDGSIFRLADGSVAPGSTQGVGKQGWVTRMERIGDRWIVMNQGVNEDGCL